MPIPIRSLQGFLLVLRLSSRAAHRHALGGAASGLQSEWQVRQEQVREEQQDCYDDDNADEQINIAHDLHADQDAHKKADGPKDELALRHRNSPSLRFRPGAPFPRWLFRWR